MPSLMIFIVSNKYFSSEKIKETDELIHLHFSVYLESRNAHDQD